MQTLPGSGSGKRPRVVVIGGGFAGLTAARALGRAPVDLTLIDRTNHHLFQPLLYQVATAALSPSNIAVPIRWLLRRQKNTTVLLADVQRIDPSQNRIVLEDKRAVEYDYLVLATGARHSYFGRDEWEERAPGLKSLEDALEIRRRFLLAFEMAEKETDAAARREFLTFVIVGGGPTGVELAGVLPEIARNAIRDDFRNFDTRDTRVVLVEAGPRILPAFPEELSERAKRDLERLGVQVRTGAMVTDIEPDGVCVGEEKIPARTVIWAAGNEASPLARSLGVALDRAGRVPVERDLSVPGHNNVFVAGDVASVKQEDGRPVPGVAPAAMQMGHAVAANILRAVRGEPRQEFRYFDKGNLAVIGRNKGIAHIGKAKFAGFVAWFLWLFIHILYLVGFRNRMIVLIEWAYAYLTYQRGVRLITDGEMRGHRAEAVPPPKREAAHR